MVFDATIEHAELPPGWVLTTSGRLGGHQAGNCPCCPFPSRTSSPWTTADWLAGVSGEVRIYLGDWVVTPPLAADLGQVPTPDNAVCSRSRPAKYQ